ncbi:hypothetical protein RKD46_003544 [Streptomyces pseudovenezuelae]
MARRSDITPLKTMPSPFFCPASMSRAAPRKSGSPRAFCRVSRMPGSDWKAIPATAAATSTQPRPRRAAAPVPAFAPATGPAIRTTATAASRTQAGAV